MSGGAGTIRCPLRCRRYVCGVLGFGCVPFAVGCGGSDDGSTTGVRVESFGENGVPVVLNAGSYGTSGGTWWVASEPRLRIKGEGQEVGGLFGIPPQRSVVRTPDGTVVVVNGLGEEVVFFSPDGVPQAVVRAGEGPGEFRAADAIFTHPDGGVAIWDARSTRVVMFDARGDHERSIRIAMDARPAIWQWGGLRGVLPDGSFVMLREFPLDTNRGEGEVRRRYFAAIHSADGTFQAPIETFKGPALRMAGGAANVYAGKPFEGPAEVLVGGNSVYVVDGMAAEVRVYGADGATRRIIRRENPHRRVTEADIASHRAFRTEFVTGPAARGLQERLDAIEWPPLHSAFTRPLVSPSGVLLVMEPGACGEDRFCWAVYDASGTFVGRPEIPDDWLLQQLDESELVTLQFGEANQALVAIHGMERR